MKVLIRDRDYKEIRDSEHIAREVVITLSNGMEFYLKEREDTPGALDISVDGTVYVYPRASNVVRLRIEK